MNRFLVTYKRGIPNMGDLTADGGQAPAPAPQALPERPWLAALLIGGFLVWLSKG